VAAETCDAGAPVASLAMCTCTEPCIDLAVNGPSLVPAVAAF
jgi:hypothetical protein